MRPNSASLPFVRIEHDSVVIHGLGPCLAPRKRKSPKTPTLPALPTSWNETSLSPALLLKSSTKLPLRTADTETGHM